MVLSTKGLALGGPKVSGKSLGAHYELLWGYGYGEETGYYKGNMKSVADSEAKIGKRGSF